MRARLSILALGLTLPVLGAAPAEGSRRSAITVVTVRDAAPAEGGAPQRPADRKKRVQKNKSAPVPAAELVALNSHEHFVLRPGPQGGFAKATMRALARFLRCHHTGRVHPISERLARLLYATASHFEFARLEVVAGYRAPKIAKQKGNSKSPHKRGVACDFRVAGVTNEVVRDFVRTFPRVGVGFYPNSGFVHLDVRDKLSAFWVDYSAPGERAQYSKTPDDDVRKLATPSHNVAEGADPQGDESLGGAPPKAPAMEPTNPQED